MKRKIIFFLATINGGGAERVTITLMKQVDHKIFDIYLVLVSKEGDFIEQIPQYIEIIDLKSKKTVFSIFSLRKIIKSIKPNIIYSTLFRTHIAIELALKGLIYKPKRLYRSPTSPKILANRGEISKIMWYLIGLSYRNANTILAQTPEMREEICKYHKIDKNKILVLTNPVDRVLIDEKIKNSLNPFDSDFINIVSAGRLSKVKGFDILLSAFHKVNQQNSNFFLHILGRDGGERENLKSLAKELDIENRVKFWGFQDNPYKFFYHGHLFVLSSRREGLPNTVLENLYLQKPVVATRCIAFMSELIDDKKNGFLVDVDDDVSLSEAILNYKKIDIKAFDNRERKNALEINSLLVDLIK